MYTFLFKLFLLVHGKVSENWKEWDKCKPIASGSSTELYQTRRKYCENIWSPDQNGVTCDPALALEDTRACHIGNIEKSQSEVIVRFCDRHLMKCCALAFIAFLFMLSNQN